MRRSRLIPCAYLLDASIGDPESFPHPVRFMGAVIVRAERTLRASNRSPQTDFVAGALLTATVVAACYLVTDRLLRVARKKSPWMADAIELLLASTCIAARNLQDEATSVLHALEASDLPRTRLRLARIVGRDTGNRRRPVFLSTSARIDDVCSHAAVLLEPTEAWTVSGVV